MQSTSSSNTNIRKTNSFSFFLFPSFSLFKTFKRYNKEKRLYNFARKLKSFPAVWEISKSTKKKNTKHWNYKLNKRRCNFSLSIFIRHFFFRDGKTFRISIEQLRRWRRLYRHGHLFQKNSSIFFSISLYLYVDRKWQTYKLGYILTTHESVWIYPPSF